MALVQPAAMSSVAATARPTSHRPRPRLSGTHNLPWFKSWAAHAGGQARGVRLAKGGPAPGGSGSLTASGPGPSRSTGGSNKIGGSALQRRSLDQPATKDQEDQGPNHGAGPHHHHRRPAAQPQERHRRDPQEEAGDPHRRLGLREVEPGLRHPLRRGPAALHREPVRLRPAVPRPDGQAGLRLHPGPGPDHLHRAEGGQLATRAPRWGPSPRSTTTCACCGRGWAASPATTAAGPSRSSPRSRSSTRSPTCPRARSSWSWPPWSRSARASTAT